MAIAINLTPIQQQELEKVFQGFKETNEKILWEFFHHAPVYTETAKKPEGTLEEKIDALNRRLDLIFGNHIFIDGKLVPIKT